MQIAATTRASMRATVGLCIDAAALAIRPHQEPSRSPPSARLSTRAAIRSAAAGSAGARLASAPCRASQAHRRRHIVGPLRRHGYASLEPVDVGCSPRDGWDRKRPGVVEVDASVMAVSSELGHSCSALFQLPQECWLELQLSFLGIGTSKPNSDISRRRASTRLLLEPV